MDYNNLTYPVLNGRGNQDKMDAALAGLAVNAASNSVELFTELEKAGMVHVYTMPEEVIWGALNATHVDDFADLVCNSAAAITEAADIYDANTQDINLGILLKLNASFDAKDNMMENNENINENNGYILALAKMLVQKSSEEITSEDWGVIETAYALPASTPIPATALLRTSSAEDVLLTILESNNCLPVADSLPVDPAQKLPDYRNQLSKMGTIRDSNLDQAIYTQMGVEDEDEALVRIARALNDASTDKAVDTIASDAGSTVTEVSEAVTAARQAPKTFAAEAVTAASAGNGWADLQLARERTGSVSGGSGSSGTSSDGMSGWAIAGLAVAGAAALYGGYRFFSEGEVEDVELVDLDDAF